MSDMEHLKKIEEEVAIVKSRLKREKKVHTLYVWGLTTLSLLQKTIRDLSKKWKIPQYQFTIDSGYEWHHEGQESCIVIKWECLESDQEFEQRARTIQQNASMSRWRVSFVFQH